MGNLKCKHCGKKIDKKNKESYGECMDCGEIFCKKCLRSCSICSDSPFCINCIEDHIADHEMQY